MFICVLIMNVTVAVHSMKIKLIDNTSTFSLRLSLFSTEHASFYNDEIRLVQISPDSFNDRAQGHAFTFLVFCLQISSFFSYPVGNMD